MCNGSIATLVRTLGVSQLEAPPGHSGQCHPGPASPAEADAPRPDRTGPRPVRLGTFRRPPHLPGELPANVRASVHVPSADAAAVRDASGGSPESVGPFPGLLGACEAVFHVGPGRHEFSGPDVKPIG
jgi:hypothetical protein